VFAGLVNQAKGAATGLVLKYLTRTSVAIPFVIALGFAMAAISMLAVQRFGYVFGYWIMAASLTLIGVIATIAMAVKEQKEENNKPDRRIET